MAINITPVTLEVKDFAPREVISVDYAFHQATDNEGQISGIPRGGKIVIRVKAMNDGNDEMVQWMLNEYDAREMKITMLNTIDGKVQKTIEGTGCYCVHFEEKWEDKQQHYEEITVTCQTIKVGPAEYNNPWK